MLPAVLAPFGGISLLGWIFTSVGVIFLALILGRLAHSSSGAGGPYAFTRDAFGDFAGFIIGWSYWVSVTLAVTAVAIVFSGYLGAMVPALGESKVIQTLIALAAIWGLTVVNIIGVSQAASLQLVLTILKIIPLLVIIGLGCFMGSLETMPAFNPKNIPIGSAIASTALLTMWAFIGVEAAVIPAGDIIDPKRTIPRAVVSAAITVAVIYILVTVAVMMLVPSDTLASSEAPFVDAAKKLGPWGAGFIGIGALLSTAGSLNGNILVTGQMPMAVAEDGLAPRILARKNKGHAPVFSLFLSSIAASALLALNLNDNLIEVFTFLISISTLCVLTPYTACALAELKRSWRSAKGWTLIAGLTVAYMIVAAAGSGLGILAWGLFLMAACVPFYFVFKRQGEAL